MNANAILCIAFRRLCELHGVLVDTASLLFWEPGEAEAWLIKIAKGATLWYYVNGQGLAEPVLKKA